MGISTFSVVLIANHSETHRPCTDRRIPALRRQIKTTVRGQFTQWLADMNDLFKQIGKLSIEQHRLTQKQAESTFMTLLFISRPIPISVHV